MKFAQNPADNIKEFMWNHVKSGGQKPNIDALKESVYTLIGATTQKTAGQRKNKPNDIDWSELDMVLWEIVIEATSLVLSGKLDEMN